MHRMQDVVAINRAGCDHRMVALAKSTPSSRATMSYQAKNATVMLVYTAIAAVRCRLKAWDFLIPYRER